MEPAPHLNSAFSAANSRMLTSPAPAFTSRSFARICSALNSPAFRSSSAFSSSISFGSVTVMVPFPIFLILLIFLFDVRYKVPFLANAQKPSFSCVSLLSTVISSVSDCVFRWILPSRTVLFISWIF